MISRSSSHVIVRSGTVNCPAAAPDEIRAFSTCRNERLRLPAFLRHYRDLGVNRFFVVDNDSSDGSVEYLTDQPDVHLFRTANRYSEAGCGVDWLNELLREFGVGGWCVTVDIDELLLYPGSEHASLQALTRHLDQNGHEALFCLLLDLYPAGSLKECAYAPGDALLEAAPYFDPEPYERLPVDLCPGTVIRGGMRERIFYPEYRVRSPMAKIYDGILDRIEKRAPRLRDTPWLRARRRRNPPCLTKVPLVRWDERSKYLNIHWISRKTVAPETGVLMHFKFLHDFHARSVHEAARGEHYDEASEYRKYADKLNMNPEMTLRYEGSTRFEGSTQLVRLGLMQDTELWANARANAGVPR